MSVNFPGTPGPPLRLRWHVLAAVAWYVFDALLMCQGGISYIALLIALVPLLVGLLVGIVRRQRPSRRQFVIFCLYAGSVVATVTTVRVNNHIASARGDTVVAAIERYHAAYHEYPKILEQLVPEFLPEIPRAKYCVMMCHFRYHRLPPTKPGERPRVSFHWVYLPPFGRVYYDFNQRVWRSID